MSSDRIRLSVAEAREHSERALARHRLRCGGSADHRRPCDRRGAVRLRIFRAGQDPQHSRAPALQAAAPADDGAARDRGLDSVRRRQQCRHAGDVPRGPRRRSTRRRRAASRVVGVTNSWMSGRSAYYVEMIAKADLVGIHTAASARSVAPSAAPARRSAPTRSPSACRRRAGRWSLTWEPRPSWGPIWRIASGSASCSPRGWRSMREGQPTRDPATGEARRAAAVRRL